MEPQGGGDLAVRLYAVAAQVYALYVQGEWVKRQCFPQSAEGEYLEKHAALRGLERRAASAATGVIRFETDAAAADARVIPAGTVCMTAGLVRFETVEEGAIAAGSTFAEVRARALEAGAAGNAAAGAIRAMAVAPVGVARCINPQGFAGGADVESDAELRKRVLGTFKRLPNGANAAFYQQGAMSFEQVAAAAILPRSRGVGTVDVVIATRDGAPGAELLEELRAYFEARREIAVDVQVKAPSMKAVEVSVKVLAEAGRDGDTVRNAVGAALTNYFDGTLLGQNVLRARLGELIFGVEGVENYALLSPGDDVAVSAGELPRLGTLTVEKLT
ncbi:MAG: phage tail protein [Clostridia bacterium]|nr:phage tail protein [Clostridia bacterium]